jgi:MFS transporter, DHA1 family, multidrug resistance protein
LVANVLAQLAFGLLAMTICLPSMQEWAGVFEASQASVQLTFSGFVVTYGSLQLVYGPLSDRVGRKKVLMSGVSVALLGSVVAALAPSLTVLIWARVVQGAGAAAGMVVGRAMVQDLFDGPERTRMMAFVGMAMGLCPPLATIVGGQLHVHLGWRANFVLIAVIAACLLVAAWKGLPAHRPGTSVQPHWLRTMVSSYWALFAKPAFFMYVGILAMTTATFYAFLGGAALVLGSYGVRPDGIGFYIMVVPCAYIAGSYLTSRVVRTIGGRRMMGWGQMLTVGSICLMLVLALAGLDSPLAFVLPLMLLGLGHGLLVPPALAGTVGLLPALAGSAAAVAGVAQQLTGAFGGFAVGWFPQNGAINLGWLMLAFALCGSVMQWLLHRGERAQRPQVSDT